MAFATDADLLMLEPALFRDVRWASQTLVKGNASISSGIMAVTSEGLKVGGLGIEEGHIVMFAGVPLEIVDVLSNTTLQVSILRSQGVSLPHTPSGLTTGSFEIVTFRQQLDLAHRQVLRLAGIEPDIPEAEIGAQSVVNRGAVRAIECYLALMQIFAGAASIGGGSEHLRDRAAAYAKLASSERGRLTIEIDADGDGEADVLRRLSVLHLERE